MKATDEAVCALKNESQRAGGQKEGVKETLMKQEGKEPKKG